MVLAHGYKVVCLPVAHCALNPIEMAWAQVKGHIKANNCAFNLAEVGRLAQEGFELVTPECWASLFKHVQKKWKITTGKQMGLQKRIACILNHIFLLG